MKSVGAPWALTARRKVVLERTCGCSTLQRVSRPPTHSNSRDGDFEAIYRRSGHVDVHIERINLARGMCGSIRGAQLFDCRCGKIQELLRRGKHFLQPANRRPLQRHRWNQRVRKICRSKRSAVCILNNTQCNVWSNWLRSTERNVHISVFLDDSIRDAPTTYYSDTIWIHIS